MRESQLATCPSAASLSQLPTIREGIPTDASENLRAFFHDAESDHRVDLKFETGQYRFWLCTSRNDAGSTDWRDGAVIRENVVPDDITGECEASAYCADEAKERQRLDRLAKLKASLALATASPEPRQKELEREQILMEIDKLFLSDRPLLSIT